MTGYVDRVRSLLAGITPGEWWTPSRMDPAEVFAGTGSGDDTCIAEWIRPPDAAFIAEAPAAVTHLLARLDAVEAIHTKSSGHSPLCDCGIDAGAGSMCNECREEWPCPTVRAITGDGGMARFQDALGDYYDGGGMGEPPKREDYSA